jgi:TamB, inner membrane protein subunit of TAM complex
MNLQGIKNRIYWWFKRIVLYGLYTTLCLLIGSFLVLQIPSVQTGLTSRIMNKFSKVSGFKVAYDRFYLIWYDRLEIDGLTILDPAKNTMIGIERLRVNFRISDLWQNHDINIDGASIDGAQVNLVTIPVSDTSKRLNINIFVSAISSQFAGSGSNDSSRSTRLNIGEIVLDQCAFSYNDSEEDSIREGFDYFHFRVGVPDGEIEDFKVIGDTVQLHVRTLVAQEEKTKLAINEFKTFFRFSKQGMEFMNMQLKAGQSVVTDTILFHFKNLDELNNEFNTKVSITANLKKTIINPADLALFMPGAEKIGQPLHLDGTIKGRVSRFTYSDMHIGFGSTVLRGKLSMDGLPALPETFMTLDLKEADITPADLRFLFSDDIYERLKPLGRMQTRGKFTGFVNDFVANGDFTTRIGKIKSDINLKIIDAKADESTYRGSLKLDQFDLGTYLNDTTTFQKVSLNGNISGKGLTQQTANFLLNGQISSIGLWHYNYLNITTDAQFASQLFNGKLTINDPHLKFNASGSIDFRAGHNLINVKANLDTAWLQDLHLSREKIFISSYMDINSRGLELDSLFGEAVFKNTTFAYGNETIHLDSVHLISDTAGKDRILTLRSSVADVILQGNYFYSSLFNDLTNLFHEFYLNLKNDKKAIAAYYAVKPQSLQEYQAKISVKLHDINPITHVFAIPLEISKNTFVAAEFNNGQLSIMHAYSHVDTIRYEDKIFFQNEIEFSGSKLRDSTEVLSVVTLNSETQDLSKALKTKNLVLQGIWNGDHVDVDVDVDQVGNNNLIRLKSEIDFLPDSTKFKILPSRIVVLEREWRVDQKNYALVSGREWQIHDLRIHHEDQLISLDGFISEQVDPLLKLTISNLNLDILNTLSTEKFKGTVNGTINARDLYRNPYVQNNVSIVDLTINEFLVGNITGTNIWNQQANRFDINFFIDRLDKRIVDLSGFYNPGENLSPLSITAHLQQMNLKIIEPVLKGIFSQIDGTISGEYTITGTFGEPKINGEGKILDGQIMIDYLRTLYSFTGSLGIVPNQIQFKNLILVDALKNKGTVNGYLAHRNFSNMSINLDARFSNLQVLNTTAKDNNLFFGQAFSTGALNITGPISNMQISSTRPLRTEKNTKIYIPINGAETIEKKDFINFAHFTDTALMKVNKGKPKEKVELSGITLDLNLEITPSALVDIIFDIKSGDIIRARGNGDIKVQLDTKGEFNMFGSVEFTEGGYNFTLYDIINKEFVIRKGSRIAWYGDPYQGNMSITASYNQLASLAPILSDQSLATSTAPAIRRRYPIEVILKLDGAMLAPQINFDIDAKDLPNNVTIEGRPAPVSLAIDFSAFKARLDEQELKKQVFSLIMLRRFSPYGESISTSGGISNSVSELFSNQLSYWLSQVDQNLEIDLDLGAFDQEAFNTFQLRLSYSFLNGRLRVTRDGAFNNQYNSSNASTIAGDWTVDYLLTTDGKFKVKMYSRNNANTLTSSLGTQTTVTTGVSLLHTQNFNQISDLIHSARERKKREMEKLKNDQAIKEEEEEK